MFLKFYRLLAHYDLCMINLSVTALRRTLKRFITLHLMKGISQMLSTLTLALVILVPAPPPAPVTPATSPPPRVLELIPDKDGKIKVTVARDTKINVAVAVPAAGGAIQMMTEERTVPQLMIVDLTEVRDLTVTTADGKAVSKSDALKRLEQGGRVVVPANGKKIDPRFLKLFKDDVLILSSADVIKPQGETTPAVPAMGGRAMGGAGPIRIQVMPAMPLIPAAPPVPVAPPAPVPPPAQK